MAKPFSNLRDKMSPERQLRNREVAERMMKEMPLYELRQARRLSQQRMAELLEVGQSAISKMERRTDMYLSTLRSYVEAMGGELIVQATFPDGVVRITQFTELEEEPELDRDLESA